jgi:hypothetical protein
VGFFSKIIRDSQKPVGRAAADRSVRVTPAATGPPSDPSDPREPVASRNSSLNPIEESPEMFWEEEVGQSGAARAEAQPSELEDRQVVGPSPLENTDDSDLAKVPEDKSSFPHIGKRKQTGLKNRRDVTVQPVMRRDQNLHGLVSFGNVSSSSEDSSVVKPVSKRPEQSARGKSVKVTHRSRQAVQTTRAGATTPPIPIASDGSASPPASPAPKPVAKRPVPEGGRAAPSDMATPPETAVPQTEALQAKRFESPGAAGEPPALASPPAIEDGASPVPPDPPAAEAPGDAGQRTVAPAVPEREVATAGGEDLPAQNAIEMIFPDAQAPEPFQADSRQEPTAQAVIRPPVHEPRGPQVHIGLLEVVVLAPENPPGRKTSQAPEGPNFASRHYLRNL